MRSNWLGCKPALNPHLIDLSRFLREKRGVEQAQEQDDARADDDGLPPALPPVLAAAPAHVQVVHVGHGDGHAWSEEALCCFL